MKFQTKAIHSKQDPDPQTGALVTPLITSTTFIQQAPGKHLGYDYSRAGNPTRSTLESCFASLENGTFALATSSGCAATHLVLQLLKKGGSILAEEDLYGGTLRLLDHVTRIQNLSSTLADLTSSEKIATLLEKNPKLIWLETPTNPLLKIIDIKNLAKKKSKDTLLVVDNTFATPYFQNPLDLGADIVIHSATKYLGGHTDVLGGFIVVKEKSLAERLAFLGKTIGPVLAPFDCYLLLRSLKTLSLRMEAHQSNALKIAEFLENHSEVKSVSYPGLKSHPQHSLAKNQMLGFGGMISFLIKGDQEKAHSFLKNLKLFKLAESLGAVESLAEHPKTMTHQAFSSKKVQENLIRLSIGIEHIEDLILDIKEALGKL